MTSMDGARRIRAGSTWMGVPPRIRTLRSSGDPTPPPARAAAAASVEERQGLLVGGRVPLGEGPRRADGDPIAAEGVDSRADRAGVLEPVAFGRGTSAGGRRRHAPAEMAEAQVAEGGRFTLPGAGGLAVIGVDGAWQPSTAIAPARSHGQGASFPRLCGSPRLHAADIVGDRPCGRTVPGTHPSLLPRHRRTAPWPAFTRPRNRHRLPTAAIHGRLPVPRGVRGRRGPPPACFRSPAGVARRGGHRKMFGARHPSTAIGPGTLGPNIELDNKDRGRVSRRRVHDTGGTFQRSDS